MKFNGLIITYSSKNEIKTIINIKKEKKDRKQKISEQKISVNIINKERKERKPGDQHFHAKHGVTERHWKR